MSAFELGNLNRLCERDEAETASHAGQGKQSEQAKQAAFGVQVSVCMHSEFRTG